MLACACFCRADLTSWREKNACALTVPPTCACCRCTGVYFINGKRETNYPRARHHPGFETQKLLCYVHAWPGGKGCKSRYLIWCLLLLLLERLFNSIFAHTRFIKRDSPTDPPSLHQKMPAAWPPVFRCISPEIRRWSAQVCSPRRHRPAFQGKKHLHPFPRPTPGVGEMEMCKISFYMSG